MTMHPHRATCNEEVSGVYSLIAEDGLAAALRASQLPPQAHATIAAIEARFGLVCEAAVIDAPSIGAPFVLVGVYEADDEFAVYFVDTVAWFLAEHPSAAYEDLLMQQVTAPAVLDAWCERDRVSASRALAPGAR